MSIDNQNARQFIWLTQIPIACTLSAADRTNRDDEWRQFLDASVVESVSTTSRDQGAERTAPPIEGRFHSVRVT
jgi:hypothetical protein